MVTAVIVSIVLMGFLLIATELFNRMNKAAVAMFVGVTCWLLYICFGLDFVTSEHAAEFANFVKQSEGEALTGVKAFIAQNVFAHYVVGVSQIILFLIATMSIVEVLNNNGCFDFVSEWLATASPRGFLWRLAGITFLLSANLDNLLTVCMMLTIVHSLVADSGLRRTYGSAVVVAAACGGAFTVIGDASTLVMWVNGLITPTAFSAKLILPCMAAAGVTLALLGRRLPRRLPLVRVAPPYRGDDTVLNRWQRMLLLVVGVGGLWFIPTFHRLTLLPPFLGALCVLALLWIVNELCNRSLLGSDQMVRKRQPMALQYANMQHLLFFIGISLAMGAVKETGALKGLMVWWTDYVSNIYIVSAAAGLCAAAFNNVATVLADVNIFAQELVPRNAAFTGYLAENGDFWPLLSLSTAMGSCCLTIGSFGGFSLMRMEDVSFGWYIRHVTPKVLAGWAAGVLVFALGGWLAA